MPKMYKTSPIIEAGCGFSFENNRSWNSTIPGRLYEKLKDSYPGIGQMQDFEAVMEAANSEAEQPVVHQRVTQTNRTQFVSLDGKSIVQVQPFGLSINQLAPYTSWAEFLPRIKEGLESYKEIANPSKLLGIQLQYQNRIIVPNTPVYPEKLFNFHYVIPADLGGDDALLSGFLVGIQIPSDDGVSHLKLQISSVLPDNPSSATFLLQIVYETFLLGTLSWEDVDSWLDKAHKKVEQAFEGSITDTLREQFGEVLV